MLRGINVGGHSIIKMDALRTLYASLEFQDPQTYVQSGNVIFKTAELNRKLIAARIQQGIQKKFSCCPEIILRTLPELRSVVASNPFAGHANIEPSKLLVSFLASNPAKDAQEKLRAFADYPEKLHLIGRELFIHFPDGAGKSKLPWSRLDKLLTTAGTARNWNSVNKMLAIAEQLDA
jgi:uncharacterized protein (DUF1697 family)